MAKLVGGDFLSDEILKEYGFAEIERLFYKNFHIRIDEGEPLLKGWSRDKKFRLFSSDGEKFLLRISDGELYGKKKKQFELLEKIDDLRINASKPVFFGTLFDGSVYTVLTWLDGEDAEKVLPEVTAEKAFSLGVDAGRTMKKLHDVEIDTDGFSWWELYKKKIERKIKNFRENDIELPKKELVVDFVLSNMHYAKDRPALFQHGDYHCGNMIVNGNGIGVIDFDKNGIADPYDEFKCFCWNVYANPDFENGMINGYFDFKIPDDFWHVLSLYAAESLLGHITWAMRFGEKEINTAKKVYNDMLFWFDDFNIKIPKWHAK